MRIKGHEKVHCQCDVDDKTDNKGIVDHRVRFNNYPQSLPKLFLSRQDRSAILLIRQSVARNYIQCLTRTQEGLRSGGGRLINSRVAAVPSSCVR